jgi:predicted HD phosphohydrolase
VRRAWEDGNVEHVHRLLGLTAVSVRALQIIRHHVESRRYACAFRMVLLLHQGAHLSNKIPRFVSK